MLRSLATLKAIHKFSSQHRELIEASDRAGCFYCGQEFAPSEIVDWVDLPPGSDVALEDELAHGVTALCPRCGIDSVLPSAAPIEWDDTLLRDMRHQYFGHPA